MMAMVIVVLLLMMRRRMEMGAAVFGCEEAGARNRKEDARMTTDGMVKATATGGCGDR